jgi:dTDP-4-dehydrorhamnose reductase
MKVLITGANGMLGSSLCQLYHEFHEVHVIHRDQECFTPCSGDSSLDLTDSAKLQKLFNTIKPDLVIHCAGLASLDVCEKEPTLAYETNVTISEIIARICTNETKLVNISTDQVYGDALDRSEEGNEILQPLNQYGKTKLKSEERVRELCTNHINVRTNIFGWNAKPGRVSSAEWIYNSLKDGKEITLFTDYTFSPIYTKFLGEVIIRLVESEFVGVINVGAPEPCSKYEFGLILAEVFGLDASYIRKGLKNDHTFFAPRGHRLDLNVSKLSSYGITAPDYLESVRKFKICKNEF